MIITATTDSKPALQAKSVRGELEVFNAARAARDKKVVVPDIKTLRQVGPTFYATGGQIYNVIKNKNGECSTSFSRPSASLYTIEDGKKTEIGSHGEGPFWFVKTTHDDHSHITFLRGKKVFEEKKSFGFSSLILQVTQAIGFLESAKWITRTNLTGEGPEGEVSKKMIAGVCQTLQNETSGQVSLPYTAEYRFYEEKKSSK